LVYIHMYIYIYNKMFTSMFLKENFILFNNHIIIAFGKNK